MIVFNKFRRFVIFIATIFLIGAFLGSYTTHRIWKAKHEYTKQKNQFLENILQNIEEQKELMDKLSEEIRQFIEDRKDIIAWNESHPLLPNKPEIPKTEN